MTRGRQASSPPSLYLDGEGSDAVGETGPGPPPQPPGRAPAPPAAAAAIVGGEPVEPACGAP